ncbi:Hypothetical protein LOCK900_2374 [Lacticaseibacillus rhamnosus LOCK900]|nr:Hypothetical protein LOCK900_2374 [Lacticaseibacillus rhamnosus LOCK900]
MTVPPKTIDPATIVQLHQGIFPEYAPERVKNQAPSIAT